MSKDPKWRGVKVMTIIYEDDPSKGAIEVAAENDYHVWIPRKLVWEQMPQDDGTVILTVPAFIADEKGLELCR